MDSSHAIHQAIHELSALDRLHDSFALLRASQIDEPEAPAFTGLSMSHDFDELYCCRAVECFHDVLFARLRRQPVEKYPIPHLE